MTGLPPVFDTGKKFFTVVKLVVQEKYFHREGLEDILYLFLNLTGRDWVFLGNLL